MYTNTALYYNKIYVSWIMQIFYYVDINEL